MDILERLRRIEERLSALENQKAGNKHIPTNVTQYFPQITEEMSKLTLLDPRRADEEQNKDSTRIDKVRRVSNPHLAAAVDAVSRAVEMQKQSQLLVEEVQHLARSLMDSNPKKEG